MELKNRSASYAVKCLLLTVGNQQNSRNPKTVQFGNISDSIDEFRTKKSRFEEAGTQPKFGFMPTQIPCLEAS